jgi:hypothetical protein
VLDKERALADSPKRNTPRELAEEGLLVTGQAQQLGPALVCRRLAGLRGLRRRPYVERVEAETEPGTEPQGGSTGRGRERSVLPFGVEHPAVAPETKFPPDEAMQYIQLGFVGCQSVLQHRDAQLCNDCVEQVPRDTATDAASPLDADRPGIIVERLNVAG